MSVSFQLYSPYWIAVFLLQKPLRMFIASLKLFTCLPLLWSYNSVAVLAWEVVLRLFDHRPADRGTGPPKNVFVAGRLLR